MERCHAGIAGDFPDTGAPVVFTGIKEFGSRGTSLDGYAVPRIAAGLALYDSLVAGVVIEVMANRVVWVGTAADLLDVLTKRGGERVSARDRWPRSASGLSSELRRVASQLRMMGVIVKFGRRSHSRFIAITAAENVRKLASLTT
jgi:hypothetical protein